jgi:hypothetical protein
LLTIIIVTTNNSFDLQDDLSMKTLQMNSMGDTNTVYSEINFGDDPVLDKEMHDVLGLFNQRIELGFERKASPA